MISLLRVTVLFIQRFPKFLQQPMKTEVRSRFTLHLMIGYLTHIIFLKIIVRVKIANHKAQCKT